PRQVIDDHASAPARKKQCVLPAEPAASARDDRNTVHNGMTHLPWHCAVSGGSGGDARPMFQFHGMPPLACLRHTTCSASSYMPGYTCALKRGFSANSMYARSVL